jgi:hypothetical protein
LRRHPVWAVALGVVAAGMTVVAVTGVSDDDVLRSRGVQAQGVVRHVTSGRIGNGQLVEFTTAAGQHEFVHTDSTSFLSVGDNVAVVYDPQHPGGHVVLARDLSTASEDRLAAGAAATTSALGAVLLSGWRPRRRRR